MTEVLKLGEHPKRLDLDVLDNGLRRECPHARGVFFTVLPWGTHNRRYKRALQKRAMRERAERNGQRGGPDVDMDNIEETAQEYLLAKQEDPEFVVDAVVKDIDGILNENGNPVKYTRERGIQLLSDPAHAHILDWVVGVSFQAMGTYEEEVTEAGKNSGSGSGGKKAGAAKSKKTKAS